MFWFISGLLLSARFLQAFAAVTPFSTVGTIDGLSAGSEFNSGGTLSVNGYSITVPDNLIVQFPAAWVPWKDVVAGGFNGYEVSIVGNVVDGRAIAGQIELAQLLLHAGSGYVESINNAAGSMKIAGGPTIKINDPNKVYSVGYTGSPLFTADDENPSITAFSGFPMCIPRSDNDNLCPSSNRPAGQRRFTAPDPLKMAPFAVGDYLEFSGIKVGGEVICFEIAALNVQILSSSPAFIRVEDAIIGVYDGQANAEWGDSRFIGVLSDCSASVTISAIDVDPCTGEETDRTIGSASPKAGDPRCKWTFRTDSTTLSKYTREYRIKVSTGTKLTDSGILAGQYIQPVTEWIFPELATPGAEPPVNTFSQFTHLVNGIVQDDKQFGQLKPWPGANAPAPAKVCSGPVPAAAPAPVTPADTTTPADPVAPVVETPVANAGVDVAQRPGVVVTLQGSNTNDKIAAADLVFAWTQISGPTGITLAGANTAKATFTAPTQADAVTNREFQLTVSSKSDATIKSTDTVVVKIDKAIKDVVTITSYTHTNTNGGTLSVTAQTNVMDGSVTSMSLVLSGTTTVAMTNQQGGKWSYNARSTKKPTSVLVRSPLGGTDSKTAVTARRRSVLERREEVSAARL
ncbi:hypothetical protein H2201_004170 [Coniosporium apollinis]|uniref:Uncharacterized protein n=1 Tax=Coniosporium apollinis TaxID=61459 RepID=A0ABQ9NTI6_9PEZI|nr:hypothetical protein H2201_004170 [Coniosporium apollinis]